MSFDTPNGTRGARQPKAGLLMRWFNGWIMNRIRRKGGKVMGMDALVLTTVGRKSGVERSSPVAYFPDGNDALAHCGVGEWCGRQPGLVPQPRRPSRPSPSCGGRRKVAVSAEQLHGQAREQAWRRIKNDLPRFAKYEQKTDRELPVIRLQARSASGT